MHLPGGSARVIFNQMDQTGLARTSLAFPIVGVGASAGGLEACKILFGALSMAAGFGGLSPAKSGMAFILVQDLDPSHHSMMAELLSGHTTLVVAEAKDGQIIKPDHLYLIPPSKLLAVSGGVLRLSNGKAALMPRLPLDHLLQSMAVELGPRAVAVVLTGTGSDGSVGIADIRAAGGTVLVQDPNEASFDGMPRSAIATGHATAVARLAVLANTLIEHANINQHSTTRTSALEKRPSADLVSIIDLMRAKTLHDFSHYKFATLQRRIDRRMRLLPRPNRDIVSYLHLLNTVPEELERLAQDLLINVTSFFRDAEVFALLENNILPAFLKMRTEQSSIRIWIAGCSTGEEAYSFAILFKEALDALKSPLKLQIFASDADADALMTAREGYYIAPSGISKERLARHFTFDGHGYRISADLRGKIIFTQQDLLVDPPFARMDMISCRNLMIYLDPTAQAHVVSLFHFALVPNGLLLLGKAETAGLPNGRFAPQDQAARLYRNLERVRSAAVPVFSGGQSDSGTLLSNLAMPKADHFADLVHRHVLDAHAPATVLVNARFECLYMLGPTDCYFRVAQGVPATNILAIARDGLAAVLGDALNSAATTNTVVNLSHKRLHEESSRYFTLSVTPITQDREPMFLICITAETAALIGEVRSDNTFPETNLHSDLIAARADLTSATNDLAFAMETARTNQEEALSISEEYQAANEELLASQEELQSLNEKLTALNTQLQETLNQQRTTSDDLQNVLYSTDVATLFLDSDMCIRFFTPATRAMFRLRPGDIGRPLSDLSSMSSDNTILDDSAKVLADYQAIDRDIEARDETWFRRRIMPYKSQTGAVEGVVITFTDITDRRKIFQALAAAERTAQLANAAKTRFLAVASHDLRQPLQTMVILQGLLATAVTAPRAVNLIVRLDETLIAMGRMLDVLLDINQIEAGVIQPERMLFPINDIFAKLRDEFAYTARARRLDLRIIPCSLAVHSDPALVEQMLRNLLSNALKYTEHGRVLIGVRRRANHVAIEVWDSGIGIEEAEITAIFEEYHQINNPARERGQGLGLGLNIVQRLGALLDHKIRVRSVPGRGSVFAVEIAKIDGDSKAVVVPAPPGAYAGSFFADAVVLPDAIVIAPSLSVRPAVDLQGARILIVEDDPEVRDLLDLLLSDLGHNTMMAPDGPSALTLTATENFDPDLILSDFNLPGGMDGLALIAELRRKLGRQLPAILLTGDISTEAMRRIVQHDVQHLAKPVTVKRLARAVAELLAVSAVPCIIVDSPIQPMAVTMQPVAVTVEPTEIAAVFAENPTVYVVDDDPSCLAAFSQMLTQAGYSVQNYATCELFLADWKPGSFGCLILDAYLPGMNGLDLLLHLRSHDIALPTIMVTGRSDVAIAVAAMKAGAVDFVEKPVTGPDLMARITRVLADAKAPHQAAELRDEMTHRLSQLTPRQAEVLRGVLAGDASKVIAYNLSISQRTVESHRAAIMDRMGAKSVPELVRLVLLAG